MMNIVVYLIEQEMVLFCTTIQGVLVSKSLQRKAIGILCELTRHFLDFMWSRGGN